MRFVRISLLLTTTLLLFVAVVSAQENNKKIKVGISVPITGDAASYGQDLRDTILFVNKKFGENRYELIFEDDKCNGKEAVTAANKLVSIDKVDYILGFACSGAAIAALPIFEKAKTPVMITVASSARIRDAKGEIFRTAPSDLEAGRLLFRHVSSKHKKIGVLSEETEYAQDLKNSFMFDNKGALQVVERNYLPGNSDFRTTLLQLKNSNVEAIFINVQTESAAIQIVKQLHNLQWNIPIYGAYFPGSPVFLEQLGELAEGIEYVDPPSPSSVLNEEGQELLAEYQEQYQKIRSIESTFYTTYEGFRALDQAVKSGKPYGEFLKTTKFSGIFGDYSFDEEGEIVGLQFKMKKIVDGKVEELY